MGQTLTNGIYLPAEGERNCYEGLAANWTALDGMIGGYNVHIGNTAIHVTAEDKAAWNGKADASALTAHTGDTTIHVTAEDKAAWNGKADASALTAHTGDTTIHVTSADKQAWNGKADASALTAHTGDTTIHVTAADKQAWDGHIADTDIHVTSSDKTTWNTVTSKANDTDVVHKSGNETIDGPKIFSNYQIGVGSTYHFATNPYAKNTPPANTSYQYMFFSGNSASQGFTNNWYSGYIEQVMTVDGSSRGRWFIRDTSESTLAIELFVNGSDKQFRPQVNNTTDLGTSTNKWKSFNGVNPGALSLPSDRSARINISSYFTNTGTGNTNDYSVPANGYIFLNLLNAFAVVCYSIDGTNNVNYAQSYFRTVDGQIYILFPVRKNDTFRTLWTANGGTITVTGAYFIPCLGNV